MLQTKKKNPDFWVNYIINILKIFDDQWDYVLIPDCRFPNEIDALERAGFDVISVRVTRPDYDNGLTEKQLKHLSETALDDFNFDIYMSNSGDENYISEISMLALSVML